MTKKTNSTGSAKLAAALARLEAIVAYFDQDDFDLDAGMVKYDEAIVLIAEVANKIKGYELQIEEKRAHLERVMDS